MGQHALDSCLFGLTFSGGSAADVLARVEAMPSDRPRQIVTANIDHVVTLSKDPAFRNAYTHAAARTLDGMPLVWLSRLRSRIKVNRITGHDLIRVVINDGAARGRRIFLVCSSAEAGDGVRRRLLDHGLPADALTVAVPPFGFEADEGYGARLAERIRAHGTTLLIMGVGAPKSEVWVHRQGAALGNPVVLSVGEAVNVAAGLVPRAPKALQALGLEWLFRFATQPRRLFRRYFVRSWGFLAVAVNDPDFSTGRRTPP